MATPEDFEALCAAVDEATDDPEMDAALNRLADFFDATSEVQLKAKFREILDRSRSPQ